MLGDEVFSQRIDPMLLQEIFQTPFSTTTTTTTTTTTNNNNNNNKRKEKPTAGGTPEAHTLRKQVVAEYLNVWSR